MRADERNMTTVSRHPRKRNMFIAGTYSCPFIVPGYFMCILGQKSRFMASLINVNEPLISAWLAIMAAPVDIMIPPMRNPFGIMA